MREARKGVPFSHDPIGRGRGFASAAYVLGGDGSSPVMAKQVIRRCPSSSPGECASIAKDGRRRRATGPGFPLQVMKCASHGHFTVYPMGWVPYGRTAVAPVSGSGDPLRGESDVARAKWRQTVFEAAVVVSTRARGGIGGDVDGFERRHIVLSAAILGLRADIDTATTERIRGELGLAGLDHDKTRRDFASVDDAVGQARAIVPLLAVLLVDNSISRRVLRAGHLAGVWGRPLVLEVPVKGPFPPAGTPRVPIPEEAGGRPHEFVAAPRGEPPKLLSLASTTRQVNPRCTDMSSD